MGAKILNFSESQLINIVKNINFAHHLAYIERNVVTLQLSNIGLTYFFCIKEFEV